MRARPVQAAIGVLPILFGVGCSTGGEPRAIAYPNPPGCADVAASVPDVPLDAPPRPVGMIIPPAPEGVSGEVEIRVIVGADGRVDPSTVRIAGAEGDRTPAWAVAFAEGWRFEPARLGGCFVPAPFRYSVTFRSSA